MSRPVYQTDQDKANQLKLVRAVLPDRVYYDLPISYRLDYLVLREGLAPMWVECKQRTVEWGTYDGYMLSLNKFLAGQRYAHETGGHFALIVGWLNNVVTAAILAKTTPIPYPLQMGGRTDRNDGADREPVILIPNSSFKTIDTKSER